jgi:hypothetical protein
MRDVRPSSPTQQPVQHRGVLAQGTTLIPYSSTSVTRILTDPRHHWTISLDGGGQTQLAKVGVKLGKVPIYKHVRLEVGESIVATHRESVMMLVSWSAVGGPPLFPRMEGTLHADPHGSQSTRLTLNARYDPPMGALGNLIDRALMHRLAQSTMDDFVLRLATSLTDELRRETVGG